LNCPLCCISNVVVVWFSELQLAVVVVEELFQELSAIFVVIIEGRGDFIPVCPLPANR